MIIPHDMLDPDTLRAVIDEFATRDGTDLSDIETKRAQVQRGLDAGRLVITFDPDSQTCNVMPADTAGDAD